MSWGHGGCHGLLCPTEDNEERITLRVDLTPAVLYEDPPKQVLVVGQRFRIALVQLLQQAR